MTAQSRISLYTESFYLSHKDEIDQSSSVGNVAELVEIANYIYVSIKGTEWSLDDSDSRDVPEDMDEATIQYDLAEMNAGVFNRYSMTVADFLILKNMQLTAGEWYDPYTFERYYDGALGKERWRIKPVREGTAVLSIEVFKEDGTHWYSPGSFLDQGGGVWLINSWDGEPDAAGRPVSFAFIYGSMQISQVFTIPGDVDRFEAMTSLGSDTPTAAAPSKSKNNRGKLDTILYNIGSLIRERGDACLKT